MQSFYVELKILGSYKLFFVPAVKRLARVVFLWQNITNEQKISSYFSLFHFALAFKFFSLYELL
jgi:hypothetical protein